MKASNSRIILGSIATVVGIFLTGGSAIAQVADTKHNLGSNGTGTNTFGNGTLGTAEICVFCHTPHGADTTASVPLWNRTLADPTSYNTYDSLGTTSMDGATAPVGSVSIACLSCHDGTQAMDAVLNEPGSGASVATFNTGTWTGPAQTAGPVGSLSYATASIVNLGVDLRNDHPVGVQYAGGGYVIGGGAPNDPDFNAPDTANINGTQVWWIDSTGTTAGSRDKGDIQLYTRLDTTAANSATIDGGAQPYVECASCHDPHVNNGTTFLRVSNDGSAVCLACHDK